MNDRNSVPLLAAAPARALLATGPAEPGEAAVPAATAGPQTVEGPEEAEEGGTTFDPGPGGKG